MPENDVQTDLKKRARRRLVGAIALALIAAIVLPMVMDSEPRSGSNELSIRIPSQEGGNTAANVIKGNSPPPGAPGMPADSAASQQVPAPVEVPPDEPVPDAEVEKPAAAPVVTAPSAVAVSSASRSSVSSRQASSRATSSRHVDESQRARDILEGRSGAASASSSRAAAGKVHVQVGIYKDEANARETVTRAAAAGVTLRTEKAGDKTRVISAALEDRAAAERLIEKLKKAGLNGFVTAK
jgi:DedD protein